VSEYDYNFRFRNVRKTNSTKLKVKKLTNQSLLILFEIHSGGNKRKLSAALAFMANPPLVFLDEPTTVGDYLIENKTELNRRDWMRPLSENYGKLCELLVMLV
jgi:ABC-type transporter Mla maintaining outer membrane lipid asymmetry ATPase subunit MlaF